MKKTIFVTMQCFLALSFLGGMAQAKEITIRDTNGLIEHYTLASNGQSVTKANTNDLLAFIKDVKAGKITLEAYTDVDFVNDTRNGPVQCELAEGTEGSLQLTRKHLFSPLEHTHTLTAHFPNSNAGKACDIVFDVEIDSWETFVERRVLRHGFLIKLQRDVAP